MSLETELVTHLDAVFPNKVFADTADIYDPSMPYCIYQLIGGATIDTFCGPTDVKNHLVQITVWGRDRSVVNTLLRSAEGNLTAPPLRGVSQGNLRTLWDDVTGLRGAQQDFSFWY